MEATQFKTIFQISTIDRHKEFELTPPDFISSNYMDVIRAKNIPPSNILFIKKKGSVFADMLFGGIPGLFVVSHKFYSIFKNFKELTLTSVSISKIDNYAEEDKFYLLSTCGRCGTINSKYSHEELRKVGNSIQKVKIGLYFDLASWDGSDFFIPDGTSSLFVTQRVKDLININSLSNIEVINITTIQNYSLY